MREITLNKKQFSVFNDYDQFQIFADDDGFSDFDTVESDTDKLFERFDFVVVNEKDDIFGVKNGKRELLVSDATEAFSIALEVFEDIN
jgi:hypothetical protein